MGRPRSFDWDEATRLRNQGLTLTQIAEILGVTYQSIQTATNQKTRERVWRKQRERRAWIGTCIDCGAPATKPRGMPNRTERCKACTDKARATSVRPDTLRCCRCALWLPDENFARQPARKHRRGRHAVCRTCAAEAAREYRVANLERIRASDRERKRRPKAASS